MDDFEQLDHYAMLGVSRSATTDEIKRAYRQQMARFHPDRFAGASQTEQRYASRRAQRINEAYATLTDFAARVGYNRTLTAAPLPSRPPQARSATPTATPQRDFLAELYEQARGHLGAGRHLQAAATLREIQQLNPFYRDSATLLAEAEAAGRPVTAPKMPPPPSAEAVPDRRRRALVFGGVGALLLAGLGATGWALRSRASGANLTQGVTTTAQSAGGVPVAQVEASPSPPPLSPSAIMPQPSPTLPRPSPTAPVATATALPVAEAGPLLYGTDFSNGRGWPSMSGRGWKVGFMPGGYQITALPGAGNIWAYSTSPAGTDFLIGIDVTVTGGLGGLLLRYSNAGYLAFFVNQALGSYRLERRNSEGERVLRETTDAAIAVGPRANNRLVARLAGDELSLRVNGQPLYEGTITDPPATAQYGMLAVARESEVVALFNNLELRSL